jgi:hypothetical protein
MEAKDDLARGDEKGAAYRLERSIWNIILSHLKGPTGVFSGYTVDMALPDVAKKIDQAMHQAFLPKMLEIAKCNDRLQKSILAYQMLRIVMCVLDRSGAPLSYKTFCKVLDADELDDMSKRMFKGINAKDYMEPLGFKRYDSEDDGRKYVTWYFPEDPGIKSHFLDKHDGHGTQFEVRFVNGASANQDLVKSMVIDALYGAIYVDDLRVEGDDLVISFCSGSLVLAQVDNYWNMNRKDNKYRVILREERDGEDAPQAAISASDPALLKSHDQ